MSAVPGELVRAYRLADYWAHAPAGPLRLRVDEASAPLARLFVALAGVRAGRPVAGAAYVTAANPLGAMADPRENARAHAALGRDLRARWPWVFEGVGTDPSGLWPGEPSWLVFGPTARAAMAVGRAHAQNAVLWAASDDATPRLLLLR